MPKKSVSETLHERLAWQRNFRTKLRTVPGPLKRAFERICNQGCDPRWLAKNLIRLRYYPFGGRQPIVLKSKAKDRLEQLLNDLAYCYRDKDIHDFLLSASLTFKHEADGELELIPDLLIKFGKRINEAVTCHHKVQVVAITVWSHLAYMLEIIEQQTGSKHLKEMSLLANAACDSNKLKPDYLKVIYQRSRFMPHPLRKKRPRR